MRAGIDSDRPVRGRDTGQPNEADTPEKQDGNVAADPHQPEAAADVAGAAHFCTVAVSGTVRLAPWQSFDAPTPIFSDPVMTSRWLLALGGIVKGK